MILLSNSAFIAAMQRSYLVTYTACAASLCSMAATLMIAAIKRQAIPYARNTQATGFKQELVLWRLHREHFHASWLRKLFVLLFGVSICLLVTAITSEAYRENVPSAIATISSK
jgi:hypothetical protein